MMAVNLVNRALLSMGLAWLGIAVLAAGRPALGQDAESSGKKSPAGASSAEAAPASEVPAEKPRAKKTREFRGRLPAYYGKVVDEKQRKAIYAIQIEYHPKIEALRKQLEDLMKERDEKVADVLTPEQQAKVEELRAAANSKRERAKSADQ